jgi:LiaF transmembrane domain
MKTSNVFWGTLFIVLGLLVLLNNFSPVTLFWEDIWQYWPIVLVLLGISMLVKHNAGKAMLASAAAIVLAVTIFSSVKFGTDFINNDFEVVFDDNNNHNYTITEYDEDFDSSLTKAKLNVNGGVGSFKIDSTTDKLIYVKTIGIENNFNLSRDDAKGTSTLELDMKKRKFHIGKSKYKNKIDIMLNENIEWDLNFDVGAASMKLDLTKYNVSNFTVDMGAASLNAKLGSLAERLNVVVNAGASKISISVPEEVGCELKMDDVLSANNIVGFKYFKSGLYRTEGFNESEKKIFISIDCGVSSINIDRYHN